MAQHRVLTNLQSILERACYIFAETKLDHVVGQNSWNCAEAGELNRWTKILETYEHTLFDRNQISSLGKLLVELLNAITQLRHDAVHRAHVTADRLLEYVEDAKMFATLLEDQAALGIISRIQAHIQSSIEELQSNKAKLEHRMAKKKAFAAVRANWDLQEEVALRKAMDEEKVITRLAGLNLLQAIAAITDTEHNGAASMGPVVAGNDAGWKSYPKYNDPSSEHWL